MLIRKASSLDDPKYMLRKSVTCPKCEANANQACKRFDVPALKNHPVICPRECQPYYGAGETRSS